MNRLFIRTAVIYRWDGRYGIGSLTPFDGPAATRLELWCRDFRGSEQSQAFLDQNWQKCLAGARILFVAEEGASRVLVWAFDSEQNRVALEQWLTKREQSSSRASKSPVASPKPAECLTSNDLAAQLQHGLGRATIPPHRRPRLSIAQ